MKDEKALDSQIEEGPGEDVRPTALAEEIRGLKASIDRALGKRERLPQPMFWSLFHSRIKDIRRKRELTRVLDGVFGGQDS